MRRETGLGAGGRLSSPGVSSGHGGVRVERSECPSPPRHCSVAFGGMSE